jgi:hypothetical protein
MMTYTTLAYPHERVRKRDEKILINQGLTSIAHVYPFFSESAAANVNENGSRLGILNIKDNIGMYLYKLLIYIENILPFSLPLNLPFVYPCLPLRSIYVS